ncbi:MAG TPA: KTSC domain-containing protein [Candidatus Sulfotelmatobacter sp.]|nr:KTSC domain-containing protein [Candidatus Sulfotelmatobacter sp.]
MIRAPVVSSHIRSVGYDAASRTLEVEFGGGEIYHYHGVSEQEHHDLMHAHSIGKHLNLAIKGKHRHSKAHV